MQVPTCGLQSGAGSLGVWRAECKEDGQGEAGPSDCQPVPGLASRNIQLKMKYFVDYCRHQRDVTRWESPVIWK